MSFYQAYFWLSLLSLITFAILIHSELKIRTWNEIAEGLHDLVLKISNTPSPKAQEILDTARAWGLDAEWEPPAIGLSAADARRRERVVITGPNHTYTIQPNRPTNTLKQGTETGRIDLPFRSCHDPFQLVDKIRGEIRDQEWDRSVYDIYGEPALGDTAETIHSNP